MKERTTGQYLLGLTVILLLFGSVGCETLGVDDVFENEKETTGTVEAVDLDANTVTVDGITYEVTNDTEFEEGYSSLSDVSEGDEVEIEYEEANGGRRALGIEPESADNGEEDDEILG